MEFFDEIDAEEYDREIDTDDRYEFSKKEIDSIEKKLLKGVVICKLVVGLLRIYNSDNHLIEVNKLKDEWFFVNKRFGYYKCDQLDGLIKCLRKISI